QPAVCGPPPLRDVALRARTNLSPVFARMVGVPSRQTASPPGYTEEPRHARLYREGTYRLLGGMSWRERLRHATASANLHHGRRPGARRGQLHRARCARVSVAPHRRRSVALRWLWVRELWIGAGAAAPHGQRVSADAAGRLPGRD